MGTDSLAGTTKPAIYSPCTEKLFSQLVSSILCFFRIETHSLCDFEPYPLLYISLSREGCPQPKFSSIGKSEPLAAGLWVPGMKVHRVPAMEKEIRTTYSHFKKLQKKKEVTLHRVSISLGLCILVDFKSKENAH